MTHRITRAFLEAQLCRCALALGMGVVGVKEPFSNVPRARLVRAGEPHPRANTKYNRRTANTTGYYAEPCEDGGKGAPELHLTISSHNPGDGWTRYGLAVLCERDTAHYSDYPASPGGGGMTASEFSAYLRGVEHGALAAKGER